MSGDMTIGNLKAILDQYDDNTLVVVKARAHDAPAGWDKPNISTVRVDIVGGHVRYTPSGAMGRAALVIE